MCSSASWRYSRRGGSVSIRAIPARISGLGPLRQAADRPDPAGLGGGLELGHGGDPELLVELADGLRAEAGDPEQLHERRRDLGAKPLEIGHPAGRDELADLVADRPPDAGDLRRAAGAVRGDEVDRAPPDRVRGAVVGDRLERDLALDLEDVADLVEDPGEVAVRQVGRFVGEDVGGRLVRVVVGGLWRRRRPLAERGRRGAARGALSGHRRDGSGARPARDAAATTRSRPRALGVVERPVGLLDRRRDRRVRVRRDRGADRHADRATPTGAGRARRRPRGRARRPRPRSPASGFEGGPRTPRRRSAPARRPRGPRRRSPRRPPGGPRRRPGGRGRR